MESTTGATEPAPGGMMRIVGGRWAGRSLQSPGGRVRPTAEEVRSRWMDSLAGDLPGARVLDLFAGTGALGLEALSRGAARVDFVEWGGSALHALKANVTALGARARSRIFKHDALAFVERVEPGRYTIAFADPPYTSQLATRTVDLWTHRPFAGILCVEHPPEQVLPPGGMTWSVEGTAVTVYRALSAPPGSDGP